MDCGIPVELLGDYGESYPGHIVGYEAPDRYIFKFAAELSPAVPPTKVVKPDEVRKARFGVDHVKDDGKVSVGDLVDVWSGKVLSNESIRESLTLLDQPHAWWPARVIKKRGEFIIVEYLPGEAKEPRLNFSKPELDTVAESVQIRHHSTAKTLSSSDFYFNVVEIPLDLVELFKQQSNIDHILRSCGHPMLVCEVGESMVLPPELSFEKDSQTPTKKFLLISNSLEAKLKAEVIGFGVVRMLRQKLVVLNQIGELSRLVNEAKSSENGCSITEEFYVERDLLGYSIGSNGVNIKRARTIVGIISVVLNPETGKFRVVGRNSGAVEQAKRMLEYATEVVNVPKKYVARILGQGNTHMQVLVDGTGLARIRVQSVEETAELDHVGFSFTGTRSAINDAKTIISFMTDSLKEIDELESKIPPRFPTDNNYRHYRRDISSRKNSVRSSGAPSLNGDIVGSQTEMGSESDAVLIRRNRTSAPRNRKYRGRVPGGKPGSPPRQNSLPPPIDTSQETKPVPQQGSRKNRGTKRGNNGVSQNLAAKGLLIPRASNGRAVIAPTEC